MSLNRDRVIDALRSVRYPGFSRDIVAFGVVKHVSVDDGDVRVTLELTGGNPAVAAALDRDARAALAELAGVKQLSLKVTAAKPRSSAGLEMVGQRRPSTAQAGALDQGLIPDVAHVVAVASGKGGVGKSTVAVNLACAMAASGARVGLLDADIYGPSIPMMLGTREKPVVDEATGKLVPFQRDGLRFMSIGFLVDPAAAVIWRGPLVMKALEQLLRDVAWGELDYLVVDLPPGTGDAQLTLSQKIHLSGAVIVSTPQDVALADAVKGVNMFEKVGVPVLGLVENMSYFLCPHCEERSDIFGHGGARKRAVELGVPFLGEIPLDGAIRESGDRGDPLPIAEPESPRAKVFADLALKIRGGLEAAGSSGAPPESGGGILSRIREKLRG